ncbi:MAG: hypothetical protein KGL39_21450 [Patescibacteria group bacterium]|jgi:hypothetical protein|nr:hypothetical protein [Patescibacteria group bacterium]
MTYPLGVPGLTPVMIFILILWVLPWKGVALWKAARKNDLWWFIVLLVLNTVGILEILYIFVFSERKGIKSAK